MHWCKHLLPVDLGHHAPIGAGHATVRGNDRDIAVVPADHLPRNVGAQGHGGREILA